MYLDDLGTQALIAEIKNRYIRKPTVLYETDGTTGLLGVNNNALGNNWQLENYDFSPYKYLRCYIKVADYKTSSNSLTPAMIIELPLDAASRAKADNSTVTGDPCDMYIAGGCAVSPSDQNQIFTVLVVVDSTKTKFQIVCENRLYGTAQTNVNNSGRYCYKIEGCHDPLNDAGGLEKVRYKQIAPAATTTIDPYVFNDLGTVSSSITIAFNTVKEVTGYTREYTIRFVAGNDCSVTLPNNILYAGGQLPVYTPGHTYEINIVNGCAAVGEFY